MRAPTHLVAIFLRGSTPLVRASACFTLAANTRHASHFFAPAPLHGFPYARFVQHSRLKQYSFFVGVIPLYPARKGREEDEGEEVIGSGVWGF